MANRIPKIIHYCWFGNGPKPEIMAKCMESWKKYLPDYEIMEWNEDNSNLQDAPVYVQEAYQVKKYAFVSDYIRMKALLEYGGLYFDTDLEVLSSFDEYLEDAALVLGLEYKELLMTAFIASEQQNSFLQQFIRYYDNRHFILADGTFDAIPNTNLLSQQAVQWGADLTQNKYQRVHDDICIYPVEVFSAFDIENNHEAITVNSKTVHHMFGSWMSMKQRRHNRLLHMIQKIIGCKNYDRLHDLLKKK